MENEELICNYLLAQRDLDLAIEKFCDEETINNLMSIVEKYKKEIIKRMTLFDIIKDFKISFYHSRHRDTGYELCIEDNENEYIYKEISESQYEKLKEVY